MFLMFQINITAKQQRLFQAVSENNPSVVNRLFSLNPSLARCTDSQGLTTLHHASRDGHTEMCQALILLGADMTSSASHGMTSLHYAALYGHSFIVSLLLAHGANTTAKTRMGSTPLHLASKSGNLAIVLKLCSGDEHMTAVNDFGIAAIHLAAQHGHIDVVLALIDQGCDINLVSKQSIAYGYYIWYLLLQVATVQRHTPLMLAAMFGHLDIVRGLVERGLILIWLM